MPCGFVEPPADVVVLRVGKFCSGQIEQLVDETPGADGERGLFFLRINPGDLGEQIGLGEALFAGVDGRFAASEQREMLFWAGSEKALGGKAKQAFLGSDDGGEGFVVSAFFPQMNDLGKKLPELLDQPEDVVALL